MTAPGAGTRTGAELGEPRAIHTLMGVSARPTAATTTRRSPAWTRSFEAAASTAAAFFVGAVRGDRSRIFAGRLICKQALLRSVADAAFSDSACT